MPVLGDLEATRRIKEQRPEIGVVVLTIHGNEETRKQAARVGSDAFVEKEAPTEHLMAAIHEVRAASCRNTRGDES
jgi:DNA-binding NarL/FixJ family response regulator